MKVGLILRDYGIVVMGSYMSEKLREEVQNEELRLVFYVTLEWLEIRMSGYPPRPAGIKENSLVSFISMSTMFKILIILCLGVGAFGRGASKPKLTEAKECDQEACELPDCLCASSSPPAGLQPSEIPQFVFFTFDDAINPINYKYYEEAFSNRINSNKCPISATFFITHEYTDYSYVHNLAAHGHEIAMHSITHQTPTSYWANLDVDGNKREFADQVELVSHFANIPSSSVKGIRSPFLQLSGDNSFQMIKENGLTYDCSWPTLQYVKSGLFPYTLDYRSPQDCPIAPCPTSSIPGVWVVPMVDWIDGKGEGCAMVDSCQDLPTILDDLLEFIKTNFNRHYMGTRSPFGFYVHASWFDSSPIHFEAYKKFLDYLGGIDDVFVVSIQTALEWMKNPVNTSDYLNRPCNPVIENECTRPLSCKLMKGEEERYMTVCSGSCPNVYPWLDNPLGN
ncbi:hypothetical protein FQA39_LY05644 [Lamprigera yunnana]|nr:hypothetical protein FQA39_LY05644 [Lamprigera yunnana]